MRSGCSTTGSCGSIPGDPGAEDRDRFILSKGHGPIALYAILAAKGFFPATWLDAFLRHGGHLGSHPDRTQVPGVEASTGSLGHGLPIAAGVALALRAKGLTEPRVFVLCGDAELNEGSNWEAILLAPHQRLGNLTLLVVDNHSSEPDMSHWRERLGGFGWDVSRRRRPRPRRARGRVPCAPRGAADRRRRRHPGG